MAMRATGAVALSILLALAGCIGSASDADDLSAASADAPAPVDDDVADDVDTVRTMTMDLQWEGGWDTQVFGCAVIICDGIALGAWDGAYDLPPGTFAVDATIEFDAPDAQVQSYGFGVATACDGGCDFEDFVYGNGPTLSISLDGLDPDEEYFLIAWPMGEYLSGAGAQAWTPTDLTVTGTATHLIDA